MEASVRTIPTRVEVLDKEPYPTGCKPALCFRGKTYALGIINDEDMIRPITLTLNDHDESPLVMYGVEEYPVTKFISHMERIMQNKPISDEALTLIRGWPNLPEDFDSEPLAPDEPESKPKKTKKVKSPNCISAVAEEMGIAATKIRKFLRKQGFGAPYGDEKKIRKALKSYK